MKKFAYALGGAALALILMIPIFNLLNQGQITEITSPKNRIGFNSQINKVKDNAFGEIVMESEAPNPNELGRGGGGGLLAPSAVGVSSPTFVNFNYTYKGDAFEVEGEKMSVYKRIKNGLDNNNLSSLIKNKDYGLIDLSKFENTKTASINIVEDREFGYTVSLDFSENLIFINQNWLSWPHINCLDRECFDANRLKITDVPSDDELIAITDKFISDYGIDISSYGDGVVRNDWRIFYNQSKDRGQAHVPEVILVYYPLKIEDKNVYEQSGHYSGLMVDVNIRYSKVSSLSGLSAQSYERSDYGIEKNSQKIIDKAEGGGVLKQYQHPNANKTVEVELGTPVLGFARHFKHDQVNSVSTELFVPAYIFPVVSVSEDGYFYRENIIAPLVNEIYDDGGDMVLPQPIVEPAGEAVGVDE